MYVPDVIISKEISFPTEQDWRQLLSGLTGVDVTVFVLNHHIRLSDSSSWEKLLKAGDILSRSLQQLSSVEVIHRA